jgi:hypothetical protein
MSTDMDFEEYIEWFREELIADHDYSEEQINQMADDEIIRLAAAADMAYERQKYEGIFDDN